MSRTLDPVDPVESSPLFPARDPAEVAAERQHLQNLQQRPLPSRLWGYAKMSGPGWLQSAFSLGGGSLASSLFAGALLGYALLWVQPLAMVCGVIMLSAIAYVTLHTRLRPMEAVSRGVHPIMAWAWALGALISSLVWVLPQYSLSVNVIGDMAGTSFSRWGGFAVALVLLVAATAVAWNYGSARGVRVFETITRLLVAMIVLAFAVVVAVVGARLGWWQLLAGFFGFELPLPGKTYPAWSGAVATLAEGDPARASGIQQRIGTEGFNLVISGFSAAVGINMTFLFPYSLRARGWDETHSGVAKFDLWTGMLIPFAITTSLLVIAAANQFYGLDDAVGMLAKMTGENAKGPGADDLAAALEPALGVHLAHWVFGLGALGMFLSSIVMMMLVCGFVVMEMTGRPFGSAAHRIGMMLPAVGILGPLVWGEYGFYLAVPTSVLNFLLLPIAYISFWILINRRGVLGDAKPSGGRLAAWNVSLGAVVVVVTLAALYTAWLKIAG